MGTTNKTTGSNQSNLQFNPLSQGVYNQLVQGGGNVLQGFINNPFGNSLYQMGAGQAQQGAKQLGNQNMQALQQNQLVQGLGGQAGQGWLGAQQAQTGRANQAMSSQANVSNVLAALQRQMAATGMGMSFSPQLTGQSGNFSQTQSTSGLGTWLPQLLGAGMSAAMGGLTGGAGLFANPTGGSVGSTSNPGLMSPSYMPGGMGGPWAPVSAPSPMGPGMGPSLGSFSSLFQPQGGG